MLGESEGLAKLSFSKSNAHELSKVESPSGSMLEEDQFPPLDSSTFVENLLIEYPHFEANTGRVKAEKVCLEFCPQYVQ